MTTTFHLSFRLAASVGAALAASGCVTFRPIEPVEEPPARFQSGTIAPVEFVRPTATGFRCAERGATFLMMPSFNAQACASEDLITAPDPCATFTGGRYAALFCNALTVVRAAHKTQADYRTIRAAAARPYTVFVEFAPAAETAPRCAERGTPPIPGAPSLRDGCVGGGLITVPNPCEPSAGGWFAATLCHELAHLNGWARNHPR